MISFEVGLCPRTPQAIVVGRMRPEHDAAEETLGRSPFLGRALMRKRSAAPALREQTVEHGVHVPDGELS